MSEYIYCCTGYATILLILPFRDKHAICVNNLFGGGKGGVTWHHLALIDLL